MRRVLCSVVVSFCATTAVGGAWPREEGTLFIATGGNFWLSDGSELPVHTDPTLYAEYGLTDRITLGLDLHTADKGRIFSGFAFVQYPIGDLDSRNRYAVSLAYGYRTDAVRPDEVLMRGGFHYGRGMDHGWLAVDATATYGTADDTWRAKVDATWGQNWDDRWTTTLQLQTGQGFTDDLYAKISPTVIWSLNEDVRLSLGVVKGLTGDKGAGIKLETWLTF